jgi:transposase
MSIYTTGEVATILDLSVNTVRQYCKRYRIGHKHGRDWAIASSDIDAIRSRMRDDPTWTEGEGEV